MISPWEEPLLTSRVLKRERGYDNTTMKLFNSPGIFPRRGSRRERRNLLVICINPLKRRRWNEIYVRQELRLYLCRCVCVCVRYLYFTRFHITIRCIILYVFIELIFFVNNRYFIDDKCKYFFHKRSIWAIKKKKEPITFVSITIKNSRRYK